MKVQNLVKNYSKLSDASLAQRAQSIIVSLTGNTNFPETIPSLQIFTGLKNDFSAALERTVNGDRVAIAIKNQARTELLSAIRFLGSNLESLALGDKVKLLTTGFELGRENEPIPPIIGPLNLTLSDGTSSGELKLSIKAVPNAVSYNFEITEAPLTDDSKWIMKSATSREHVFSGLRSGIRTYARASAIGRKGQEVYSTVLSRIVQ